MAFKVKNKIVKKKKDSRITLDAKHNEEINKINQNKIIIDNKIQQINELKNKNEILSKNYKKNIDSILEIKDKIIECELELKNLNNDEDINYLLNTGLLLFHYYDKIENNTNSISNNKHNINITNNQNKKKVSEYFNIKSINNISKAELLNSYFNKTNDINYKNKENLIESECNLCMKEIKIFLSHGKKICENCGDETKILIDSDKPSYKDPPREICYFAYKRINHFNEWLAQFQAKESTDIPKEIYNEIILELKKERITEINNLTQLKLREILKKLKKNKYYEHIPHIINKLNGIPPPIMTRKNEEELRRMFKEIQIPFQNHCPNDRKNFLSYSYILHKFVQLLELDEFIPCFVLLKSREKLHQQDLIWKKICTELKWQFIPSI